MKLNAEYLLIFAFFIMLATCMIGLYHAYPDRVTQSQVSKQCVITDRGLACREVTERVWLEPLK